MARASFANLTPEQRSANGRKGAAAAHKLGTAHKWTVEEAKAAGRKGGLAARDKRKTAKTGSE